MVIAPVKNIVHILSTFLALKQALVHEKTFSLITVMDKSAQKRKQRKTKGIVVGHFSFSSPKVVMGVAPAGQK